MASKQPKKNSSYELPGRERRKKTNRLAKTKSSQQSLPAQVRGNANTNTETPKRKKKKINRQSAFGSMFNMTANKTRVPSEINDPTRINVFQSTAEIEKQILEDDETKEEDVELPQKVGIDEVKYLMLPFVNSLIVTFGVVKDHVMVPVRIDGKCYIDEKYFRPRSEFSSEAAYCAQVDNTFWFYLPVALQFFAIVTFLLLRKSNKITTIHVAGFFEMFLVGLGMLMFAIVEVANSMYHFMNGILLIWLVGFTFRLKRLRYEQKLMLVAFQNLSTAMILIIAFATKANKRSVASLGRTIMVPMIYSLLLWKLNNEQAVRQKAHDKQAAKLEKNLKKYIIQKKNTEKLLASVLPLAIINDVKEIAKTQSGRYCVSYDNVTILFAKITGVHEMFEELPTVEVVGQLDRLFKSIDFITEAYTIEKIKTVGDTYMCASGLPVPHPNHAYKMAYFAFALGNVVKTFNENKKLNFKTGMCIGKIVAGVIGKTKYTYDLWGDAANTASRMYSHGVKGKIMCPKETADQIEDKFYIKRYKTQVIKGKGEMDCWFIEKEKVEMSDDITEEQKAAFELANMKKENIRAKKSNKKKKGQRMSAANNKLLKLVDDAGTASSTDKDQLTVGKDNWVANDKNCQKCNKQFTFLNRRHHCRYCGMCLCQDCSQWKVQKLRACWDCKELFDEAKDMNEMLRQREEEKKIDKIRRAKKNLVSSNPCTACYECVRSGTSREWEREYLDHKKSQIGNTLTVFWAIFMFCTMIYWQLLKFILTGSCLETPLFPVKDGYFNDNRSPCKYGEAGQITIGERGGADKGEGFDIGQDGKANHITAHMNATVLEFVNTFVPKVNKTNFRITEIGLIGEEWWNPNRFLPTGEKVFFSWSSRNHTMVFPKLESHVSFALLLNIVLIIPLVVVWLKLSTAVDYQPISDKFIEEEKTRIANSCCFGGKALGGYIAVRQRIMIHGEQIITTGVMATILIVIAYQFFQCHYWFGHMLLVALYGFNTYSLLTHGIVYIVTAICIFMIILTIPINLSIGNRQYEIKDRLEFVLTFIVTVYHALVQGKSIDLSTRKSFLKTKEIRNLSDKSEQEQQKNLAMLPLPDVITKGLKENKNIVIDAYGTVLFADIVSFTVFSSSDVLAHNPEDRPKKLVEILNDMFSRHDALADRCEVDKVKTLGDCYVASCGLLAPIANHAAKLTKFGIGMHGVMGDLNDAFNLRGKGPKNKDLRIRVGLASGTVVGGVVGGKKFIFDIWGETVEMAEVMESEGVPEKVHISQTSYLRARKDKDLQFTQRNVDLSEFGYRDKSYIAEPAGRRPNQSIGDWIAQIFPIIEEEKESEELAVRQNNSTRGSATTMNFVDNPMTMGRRSRSSIY